MFHQNFQRPPFFCTKHSPSSRRTLPCTLRSAFPTSRSLRWVRCYTWTRRSWCPAACDHSYWTLNIAKLSILWINSWHLSPQTTSLSSASMKFCTSWSMSQIPVAAWNSTHLWQIDANADFLVDSSCPSSSPYIHAYSQGGAPPSYKWVIIPLTIDISPINHSYWTYLHQLS